MIVRLWVAFGGRWSVVGDDAGRAVVGDWGVLDLEGDPTPGDPDAVRGMAIRLRDQADVAEHNTTRLRAIAGSGGELAMAGDYAPAFTEALVELPDGLARLARAYRGCGDALSAQTTTIIATTIPRPPATTPPIPSAWPPHPTPTPMSPTPIRSSTPSVSRRAPLAAAVPQQSGQKRPTSQIRRL
nr:hypothetical protein [Frankia sp. Cas4]